MIRGLAASAALLVALAAGPALADEPAPESPQVLFEQANAQYYQGAYEEAARGYGRVLAEHRVEDAVLYHNLGNAYFRTGAYGSAILYYRRGLLLDPPDEVAASLERNLAVAREVLRERYRGGADGTSFIYAEPGGLLYRLTHLTSTPTLMALFLVSWWALFLLLLGWRLRGERGRTWGATAIPIAVVVALFGVLLWGRVHTDASYRLGVVVEDEVVMREGPHPDARGVDLPEGMEVRIVEGDAEAAWTRVELTNGREGWVQPRAVKEI